MRSVAAILVCVLILPVAAFAARSHLDEYSSREDALKWINTYREKPDLAGVPVAIKVLSRRGALHEPEAAGVYVGFLAGILASHPNEAARLIDKVLTGLPADEHWVVVRGIAYSGLPQWKGLLRKFANRMPTREVMIEKYLADKLPSLDRVPLTQAKPGLFEKVKGYFGSKAPNRSELTFESNPDLLDTMWGIYFATGSYQPIARMIEMLPWSKERDSVEQLTAGSMVKYTLASNAARSTALLAMLKRARRHQAHQEMVPILDEIIEAAETMEDARIRKEALAAIEELKLKGPGYKREVSFWGKVGEGTLAVGCIVAAATGQVEFGLPCVIGGGVSSAALQTWDAQK
jgi:hypothetical protein